MDWEYIVKLSFSILVFAPGLVISAALLFVGVMMVMEKAADYAFSRRRNLARAHAHDAAVNPAPGPLVSALRESLAAQAHESGVGSASDRKRAEL